ncbi:MAG TPA: DUF4124 domain-containing protein [Methylotenera sp.]|nr:DUF4124 domain-containing protein [Methylotenera sp.]
MNNKLSMRTLLVVIGMTSSLLVEAEDAANKNIIFSPTSFWYQAIPANVQLHPNSANFTQEFLRQKTAYYGTVNINTTSYASPIYYATSSTPKVTVAEWDCQRKGYKDKGLAEQFTQVPIPVNAIPAAGTDSEMSVYDPATKTLWEFWRMQKVNGSWQACWGGRIQNASINEGAFAGHYGTTATSLPFIGGQITAEELQSGVINHAIGISLVDIEKSTIFSWPAHRSDGLNPTNAPNRIPEGLRFRLDPSVNVDSLNMHPMGKVIAKAAQKYGFVVWDKAGAISIRAQNPYSYVSADSLTLLPNPYKLLFGSTQSYAILNGFPWNKLQFLPMDYGKP